MRNVLEAAVVLISFVSGTTSAMAECFCGEESFYYTTVNKDDIDHMETFPWEVHTIEPIFDMQQPDEPIVSCDVKVNLVAGDHPVIDSHTMTKEGQETIFYNGAWVSFSSFEERFKPYCSGSIS